MRRANRILQEALQAARNSRIICFVTTDRPGLSQNSSMMHQDALRHIYDLVRAAWSPDVPKLELFLYTLGGDSDVPWALMSMLRELIGQDKELNALIPYRCHSAGTISVLGADYIVMGPKAVLGPIDTTMNTPYNPPNPKTGETLPISVEDVGGYFSLLEKVGVTGSEGKIAGLKEFTQKVHPYALGMVQRLEDQTKLVARQMLSSRLRPFTDAENEAIVATLAKRINSHRHAISRSEAIKQVGLTNVRRSEDEPGGALLWDLYLAFEQKLQMTTPFLGEDEFWKDENLETKEHVGVKCGYVESDRASKACMCDIKIIRLRESFQNLTVSPQLTVTTPQMPPGVDPAQAIQILQHWLQNVAPQILEQAVNDAVEKAKKAAPPKGSPAGRIYAAMGRRGCPAASGFPSQRPRAEARRPRSGVTEILRLDIKRGNLIVIRPVTGAAAGVASQCSKHSKHLPLIGL